MYFTLFCSFHTTALVVVLGAGLVLILSGQVQSSCIQLLPPMFGVDPPATCLELEAEDLSERHN